MANNIGIQMEPSNMMMSNWKKNPFGLHGLYKKYYSVVRIINFPYIIRWYLWYQDDDIHGLNRLKSHLSVILVFLRHVRN